MKKAWGKWAQKGCFPFVPRLGLCTLVICNKDGEREREEEGTHRERLGKGVLVCSLIIRLVSFIISPPQLQQSEQQGATSQ